MSFDLSKIEATLNRVNGFDKISVQAGVPKGPTYPADRGGKSVAEVAAIQEFGAPAARIPPRPFIRPAFKNNKAEWKNSLSDGVVQVINGNTSADDVLSLAGEQAQLAIQTKILDCYEPPLSPVTVLLRAWRKNGVKITRQVVRQAALAIKMGSATGGDDKPLIDDGILLASISYAVNTKESEFTV